MNIKIAITGPTLLASLLFLAGCGGSSNDNDPAPDPDPDPIPIEVLTGIFLDSPVANVDYVTETKSGVTDADGKYDYVAGETVTFSIGALEFPPVAAAGTVTPLDIAETSDPNDPEAVNMLRLLQTLDSDGDPSNGITISDQTKDAAAPAPEGFFELPEADFASSDTIQTVIDGSDAPATELVSAAEAVAHFAETLEDEGVTFDTLVGSWLHVNESGEEQPVIFHFIPDGRYLAKQWGEANDSEGFEYGTYTASDGDVTFVTIENNDGDALTCNEDEAILCNGSEDGADPGVWSYAFSDEGQLVFTNDGGSFSFNKLTATDSPVDGLWEGRENKDFTFFTNGSAAGEGDYYYVDFESEAFENDIIFEVGTYQTVVNDGKQGINFTIEREYSASGLECSSDCGVATDFGYDIRNQQLAVIDGERMERGYLDQVFTSNAPANTARLIAQKDYEADIAANDNYGVELEDDFRTRLKTRNLDMPASSSFKATFTIDEEATLLTKPESDSNAGLEVRLQANYDDPSNNDLGLEVSLRLRYYGNSVTARFVMAQCISTCDNEVYLPTTVTLPDTFDFQGEHTMEILYNETSKSFVFNIDGEEVGNKPVSDFTGQEEVVAAGGYTFDTSHISDTRFRIDAYNVDSAGESALITVHLDEFTIDDEVYDDFTGGLIDSEKWYYEDEDR